MDKLSGYEPSKTIKKIKTAAAIGLLAASTAVGSGVHSIDAKPSQLPEQKTSMLLESEYPTQEEIQKLAPFAKSPVFADLSDGREVMGFGSMVRDGDKVLFCTASHVIFPYELRFPYFKSHPTDKLSFFKEADFAVRTSLTSQEGDYNTELSESHYVLRAKFAQECGPKELSFEQSPTNDTAVCFELIDDISQIALTNNRLKKEDIPVINENPIENGSTVFVFDRNLEPQFFTFKGEKDDDIKPILHAVNETAQNALISGDSGTTVYHKDRRTGKIEVVGVYADTYIHPTEEGTTTTFFMLPFSGSNTQSSSQ